MRKFGGKERGFTLPELMIVIVLLGILAAIAIPSWFSLVESREVESAANQFAADVRLSHSRATNQLTDWRVVFKPTGASFNCGSGTGADYCLVKLDSTSPGATSVEESIPRYFPGEIKITGKTKFPNDNITSPFGYIPNPKATLELNSDGSAEVITTSPPSSEPKVRVGIGSNSLTVNITRSTSRVEIE